MFAYVSKKDWGLAIARGQQTPSQMATLSINYSAIGDISPDFLQKLQKILPTTTSYKVVDFKTWNDTGFACTLRTNIATKEEAVEWVKLFEKTSLTTYRVDRTYKENTQRVAFKKLYHCHQNTKPRSHKVKNPHPKHVNCNSKLTITIKQQHMRRSKDPYLKDYPCEIYLRFNHNHPIETVEALRYRRPTETVKKIFLTLFENGHSPISALKKHKHNLIKKCGEDNYDKIVADRAQCPNAKWCYDLYRNVFKKEKSAENNFTERNMKIQNVDLDDEMSIQENVIIEEGDTIICNPEVSLDARLKDAEISSVCTFEVENELASCFEFLKQKLESNPDVYFDPVKSFVERFQLASSTSDESLVSFLNNFGVIGTNNKNEILRKKSGRASNLSGMKHHYDMEIKENNTEDTIYDISDHVYSKKTETLENNANETIILLSDGNGIPIMNIPVWQCPDLNATYEENLENVVINNNVIII